MLILPVDPIRNRNLKYDPNHEARTVTPKPFKPYKLYKPDNPISPKR